MSVELPTLNKYKYNTIQYNTSIFPIQRLRGRSSYLLSSHPLCLTENCSLFTKPFLFVISVQLHRLYGKGPRVIVEDMVANLYK